MTVSAIPREAWADWAPSGLCAQTDPELFFPEPNQWATTRRAERICRTCPVRLACLAYALAHHETDGVWGGFGERSRRRLHSAVYHGSDPTQVAAWAIAKDEEIHPWRSA